MQFILNSHLDLVIRFSLYGQRESLLGHLALFELSANIIVWQSFNRI